MALNLDSAGIRSMIHGFQAREGIIQAGFFDQEVQGKCLT